MNFLNIAFRALSFFLFHFLGLRVATFLFIDARFSTGAARLPLPSSFETFGSYIWTPFFLSFTGTRFPLFSSFGSNNRPPLLLSRIRFLLISSLGSNTRQGKLGISWTPNQPVGRDNNRTCQTGWYLLIRTCQTCWYLLIRTCQTGWFLLIRTCQTGWYLLIRTCHTREYEVYSLKQI